jgi:hypothetical protein
VDEVWRVPLPDAVGEPLEVYVNGVRQQPGTDYEQVGRELHFRRALRSEGKLSRMRWASMFLGIAGTYRHNDTVDVIYQAGSKRAVASGLRFVPPSRGD